MIKLTWRDGLFLFGGVLLGISLSIMWFNITLMTIFNNILPHVQIQSVNFNLNETALVEAMNKTFGGIR